ncbi:hypothetical protein HQ489_04660, partial [Candidatus Woesearchaeota archaeon]|nr:hypothetical protein [Candidatus Woesearchaeota archaeon]
MISESILIEDFQSNDFIVFDGPNGFGKTTVFDAIEIALTGEIHRVFQNKIVPSGQGAEDNVYLNNQNNPMKIVIEFDDGDNTKVLLVQGESSVGMRKTKLRADNQEYFKRFELENIDNHGDNIDGLPELSQQDINSWFNDVDLKKYYKLYHYIQQEETTFFLKMKENERMKQLGTLFNTSTEDDDFQVISSRLDGVSAEKDRLDSVLSKNKKALESIDISSEDPIESMTEYKDVFENLDFNPLWNNEKLKNIHQKNNGEETVRTLYKREIDLLIKFVNDFEANYEQYVHSLLNNRLLAYKSDVDLLNNYIQSVSFLNDIDLIRQKQKNQKKYLSLQKELNKSTLLKNLSKVNFDEIYKELPIEDHSENSKLKIDKILSLKSKEGQLSQVIRDFEETRKEILSLFDSIHKEEELPDNECPLCGFSWPEGYEQLLSNIEEKGKKISLLKSTTSKEITKQFNEFYEENVLQLIGFVDKYLQDPNNIINQDFFNQVNID